MVRLSIPTVIMIITGYAFMLAMLLFILGRYLDMRVISYTADAQRHSTNLLNLVLNSKITKEKLIIDYNKFRKYYDSDWFSYPMNDERKDWEKNNEIVEYDYNFSVIEFGGESYEFGNLIFKMSDPCYFDYQRIIGYSDMPVSIFRGDVYWPGNANLELMKTPLADLCFWISQSSLRLEKGYDDEILKSIRVGPEVKYIMFNNTGYICMSVNNKWACKSFYPESYQIRICKTDELTSDYKGISCTVLPDISVVPYQLQYRLKDSDCRAINIHATKDGIDIVVPTL